ncbi:MAG: thiamine phosphate synthase [Gammaproteobacteria bacterium]|jgi:thiamine-phosphate pyrophosphorylase
METTTDTTSRRLHGLYAITPCSSHPPSLSTSELIDKVEQAITGGARIIQYREKRHHSGVKREQAARIKTLCDRHGALFIVNDDVELAAATSADGVHLGQDDWSLSQARKRLGASFIIGVSCYNQLELAHTAQQQGADYVAFGRFFASQTKPGAVQADIALLTRAKAELTVPVACIGGITAENAKLLTSAGADMIAVIQGVFGVSDTEQAARELARCFGPEQPASSGV